MELIQPSKGPLDDPAPPAQPAPEGDDKSTGVLPRPAWPRQPTVPPQHRSTESRPCTRGWRRNDAQALAGCLNDLPETRPSQPRGRERSPSPGYTVAVPHMSVPRQDAELKKGSAEFLILSLVEDRALHGYDIARLIDVRSKGALTFYAASLYPLLYRLERRGWITGRWLEQAGARRRRMYRITAAGRRVLAAHRTTWDAFVRAVNLVTGTDHA